MTTAARIGRIFPGTLESREECAPSRARQAPVAPDEDIPAEAPNVNPTANALAPRGRGTAASRLVDGLLLPVVLIALIRAILQEAAEARVPQFRTFPWQGRKARSKR
jgi:hypothetical protein